MATHRGNMIKASAPIWLWQGEQGAWHFLTIDDDAAIAEIKLHTLGERRGFGAVKVAARIGTTRWTTSIFPSTSSGGYILPVKADVRRREALGEGDIVDVEIDLI